MAGGTRLSRIILVLDDGEIGGQPDAEGLEFHADGLFLELAFLHGRSVGRARLPQRFQGVGYLQADLKILSDFPAPLR